MGPALYFIVKIASIFSPLHFAPDFGVGLGLLLVPASIQEMVFAVRRFDKGFNPSAVAPEPAKVEMN
jgi:hypothetical protein